MRIYRIFICLLLVCTAYLPFAATTQETTDSLVAKATEAYQKKEYERSAQLYSAAIKQGAQDTGVFYNAACSFALAGKKEEAFEYLAQSINRGYANAGHLKQDTDFISLHTDARWQPLVKKCADNFKVATLKFDEKPSTQSYAFRWDQTSSPYLTDLRNEYKLEEIIAGKKSDYEKMQAVCHWVRTRWEHNGSNEPQRPDPIGILQEAATGKRFRCVEYGIVISGALNALGIPARVLGLKTKDVETRESGAGHVVAEAYLRDQKKWIMIDGQFDVIPVLNGQPLNAVEFQRALAEAKPGLSVYSFSGTQANNYFFWVAPYLFYFDTELDARVGLIGKNAGSMMLVPIGEKEPTVFQRKWPIGKMQYTHSIADFYPQPK